MIPHGRERPECVTRHFFASIVRFPDRHGPIPPGSFPGKVDKICGGHGQGETPGPIPNPEAKALHGDGTAPERVWESSAPPLSHDTVPPGRAPTGSRGVPLFSPTAPHPVIPAFISPHIHIHLYIHSYSFIHIHSYSFIPSLSVHPSCGGRPRRAHGDGGAQAPADTEGCAAGPACPRTGPGARCRIPVGAGARPLDGPPRPDGPRRTGPYGSGGGADGQGNREGHRASSLVYIGEDGGGLSVESMFHSGILSVG